MLFSQNFTCHVGKFQDPLEGEEVEVGTLKYLPGTWATLACRSIHESFISLTKTLSKIARSQLNRILLISINDRPIHLEGCMKWCWLFNF